MEYNHPSEIVKDINFGDDAKSSVIAGVENIAMEISSHALSLNRVDDVDIDIAVFSNIT